MKSKIVLFILFLTANVLAAQSLAFSESVNNKWVSQNATDLLNYVEAEVQNNPNDPNRYFARAVVAAYLQSWGRGAVSFLEQSKTKIQQSSDYTEDEKEKLEKRVESVRKLFQALADDSNEPQDSQPSWDATTHALVFSEFSNQFPMLSILNEF